MYAFRTPNEVKRQINTWNNAAFSSASIVNMEEDNFGRPDHDLRVFFRATKTTVKAIEREFELKAEQTENDKYYIDLEYDPVQNWYITR